jgi:hypothetical protein
MLSKSNANMTVVADCGCTSVFYGLFTDRSGRSRGVGLGVAPVSQLPEHGPVAGDRAARLNVVRQPDVWSRQHVG